MVRSHAFFEFLNLFLPLIVYLTNFFLPQFQATIPVQKIEDQFSKDDSWVGMIKHLENLHLPPEPPTPPSNPSPPPRPPPPKPPPPTPQVKQVAW